MTPIDKTIVRKASAVGIAVYLTWGTLVIFAAYRVAAGADGLLYELGRRLGLVEMKGQRHVTTVGEVLEDLNGAS